MYKRQGLCGDTSLPFYDALYRLNHSIKHIISRYGEDFFRLEESKVIKDFASKKGVVISIGGGAANKLTVNSIKKYTHRIWLKCSIDILVNRYEPDENARPLLYNTNNIKKSLNEYFKRRNVFYSDSANIEIDSDMHTPHELSNQILSHINILFTMKQNLQSKKKLVQNVFNEVYDKYDLKNLSLIHI